MVAPSSCGLPSQVQFSLLDRRPLNGMVQYCQKKGIKLLTYGSVAGGLLSDRYVEEPRQGLFGELTEPSLLCASREAEMQPRVYLAGGTWHGW